ncbi:MAG: hypothetical protein QOG43_1238 [Actinomycetota bacterium]|jgi:hypothetical protein|nr:hypothetical protein [Actinomycetota bacterium]
MRQWPHEHTVREWRPDLEQEFFAFVVLSRSDGVVKSWQADIANPHYHTDLQFNDWNLDRCPALPVP